MTTCPSSHRSPPPAPQAISQSPLILSLRSLITHRLCRPQSTAWLDDLDHAPARPATTPLVIPALFAGHFPFPTDIEWFVFGELNSPPCSFCRSPHPYHPTFITYSTLHVPHIYPHHNSPFTRIVFLNKNSPNTSRSMFLWIYIYRIKDNGNNARVVYCRYMYCN